ncbi:MAG: serine/threonine protein kinase, partial [Rhodothermales bacterium]
SVADDFFEEALGLGLSGEIKACDDRYLSGRFVARGGMKSIGVVIDSLTGREVAKASLIGSDDPVKVERFFHEARICASLQHPNIVPVYDLGYDREGEPFFTMRLLGGQTLQRLIEVGTPSEPELLEMFVKVCDAVAYAHSQGIIHRDLKPENIQIGEFGEVQVFDWGLAWRDGVKADSLEHEATASDVVMPVTLDGTVKGTPGYMSPEQAEGSGRKLSRSADIYALGAILYFILARKSPLECVPPDAAILRTKRGEIPPLPIVAPGVSRSLIAICEKAMQLRPEQRYESAEALKADLLKYQLGYPTMAENASSIDALKLFLKRNRRLATITVLFALTFNAALIWFFVNLSAKEKAARLAEADARAAESQAVASEQEARTAEASAKQALDDLMKVTAQRDEFSKDVAPRMVRLGHDARFEYRYDEALAYVKRGLAIEPNSQEGLLNLAYIQLVRGEFLAAERSFEGAGHGDRTLHRQAARRLATTFGDRTPETVADALAIFGIYFELELNDEQIDEMIFSPMFAGLSVSDRRHLATRLIQHENLDLAAPVFDGDSVSLPWQEVKRLTFLYGTGIVEFDFRGRADEKLQVIQAATTRKVYLPNTRPAVHLNPLQACPNLEVVVIPKEFADGEQLLELPESVKISTY